MIPEWAIRTEADKKAIDLGYTWDQQAADRIVQFAKLFRPQYISGPFTLLDWQSKFLQSLYGWKSPTKNRRFRTANLHVPKKNGKTLLCALVSAYELVASGEPSPFVVTGSVSKENASQVFNEIRHTLTGAGLGKWFHSVPHQRRITIPDLNGEYRSLSSDGDRVQGYNCSLVLLDECHAHKGAGLYDSLKYATIARNNGLVIAISTAGDDPTSYYHALYQKSKRILHGEDLDLTYYALLYESDPDADPLKPDEWRKANPSLGVSFTEENFRLDLEAAKEDPAEWLRFQRYRLNRWTRADDTAYFDVNDWDRNKTPEPDDLTDCECTIGVDLSLTTDPSSVTAIWKLPNGDLFCKSYGWVAREGVRLREKTSLPRYEEFATSEGFELTDGDMIDHELILEFLCDFCKTHQVRKAIFDPTSAVVMMNRLADETGVEVRRMPTTFRYMSAPMQSLHRVIRQGTIKHDGGNWLRYCLSNVRVEENRQDEIRPSVKRSTDHIDGAIALLCAYSDMIDPDTQQTGGGIGWAK